MKTQLKRLYSGVLSIVMAISAIPAVSAHAEEKAELYPYTMFAASDAEGLKSAYAFLEGFVYYLIDEWGNDVYTHDKYDIIADCESKQNTLMTLRNKYAI